SSYLGPSKSRKLSMEILKTDSNTLLFKIHMGAGHGGSSGRYDKLGETALEYAFILEKLGIME
ncbi:MAG: hypothetical protein C4331_18355, partial [Meiothermus sp.]